MGTQYLVATDKVENLHKSKKEIILDLSMLSQREDGEKEPHKQNSMAITGGKP